MVVGRLGIGAYVAGVASLLYALAIFRFGRVETAVFAGVFGLAFLAAGYLGRACHPAGRYLLLGFSVFLLIGFPVGTLQGVFQILHLTRPEAKLMFEGRDRFSPAETQRLAAFKNANPWLASWLRLTNFIAIIAIVGMVAAVAIPTFLR